MFNGDEFISTSKNALYFLEFRRLIPLRGLGGVRWPYHSSCSGIPHNSDEAPMNDGKGLL